MCPYVLVFAVCWGAGVSTGIVGTLRQVFSLRGAEKGLHRGVCVCLFVAGCMAQMCRLGHSVWHTEMPQEGYWCVRCSLTWNIWLPMDPSRNLKGNFFILRGQTAYPCPFFFAWVILNRLLYPLLLYLESDCGEFPPISHFRHRFSLDLIAKVVCRLLLTAFSKAEQVY